MKTPGHPVWLITLALSLAITSGHRSLDLLAVDQLTGAEPLDAGPWIGAAIMPFLAVPFVAIACLIVLMRFPARGISLFQWPEDSNAKGILWSSFFGVLAAGSIVWAVGFAYAIPALLEQGHGEYAMDSAFNLIASLGSVYLWLCFRAIACCPEHRINGNGGDGKTSDCQVIPVTAPSSTSPASPPPRPASPPSSRSGSG